MDKQAELYQTILTAINHYTATTRGAHAFGSGCRCEVVSRSKLIVHADDGEAVEIMVMVY